MISKFLIVFIVSYLLGSVDFGIIISNLVYHKDVRQCGSGNAGTTNMLRTFGKKAAAMATGRNKDISFGKIFLSFSKNKSIKIKIKAMAKNGKTQTPSSLVRYTRPKETPPRKSQGSHFFTLSLYLKPTRHTARKNKRQKAGKTESL